MLPQPLKSIRARYLRSATVALVSIDVFVPSCDRGRLGFLRIPSHKSSACKCHCRSSAVGKICHGDFGTEAGIHNTTRDESAFLNREPWLNSYDVQAPGWRLRLLQGGQCHELFSFSCRRAWAFLAAKPLFCDWYSFGNGTCIPKLESLCLEILCPDPRPGSVTRVPTQSMPGSK